MRDRRAINERFSELQEDINDEILVFTKPPYATPPQEKVEGLEVSRAHQGALASTSSPSSTTRTSIEGVRRFIEAGEEARFVPELPLKLVIIDETIVMFGMEDPVVGGLRADDRRRRASVARGQVSRSRSMPMWQRGLTFDEAHKRLVQVAKTA